MCGFAARYSSSRGADPGRAVVNSHRTGQALNRSLGGGVGQCACCQARLASHVQYNDVPNPRR